jgi:hypothetical protein
MTVKKILLVFQAMACKALDRPEEATRKAQEASLVLADAVGQGALWRQAAFYQLALKEFLALPAARAVPAKTR